MRISVDRAVIFGRKRIAFLAEITGTSPVMTDSRTRARRETGREESRQAGLRPYSGTMRTAPLAALEANAA